MPLRELRGIFPNFSNQGRITSEIDLNYNCVAWALNNNLQWWEPYGLIVPAPPPLLYYWPNNHPQDKLLQTYVRLFEEHGYEVTDNHELEDGFEKIALYVHQDKFQHVARQRPNGRWTSKIGGKEDIEHVLDDLKDLNPDNPYAYGKATVIMKKQI